MPLASPLVVDHDDVITLQRWLDDPSTPAGPARRALIVLLSAKGLDVPSVARELGCSPATVVTWRERFRSRGPAGLVDAPRSGRPPSVDATTIVARTFERPPGRGRWTSRLLAAELGVSNASVAGAWRQWGIRPTRDGRAALDTEPALPGAFSAIAGLCLRPGTAVLALERGTRSTDGRPRPPVADRLDLHEVLLDVEPHPADPEVYVDADVTAFLRDVADRRTEPGPRRDVALLVAGLSAPLVRVGAELGLGVFEAASEAVWARLARVACVVASAEEPGRATVLALAEALRRQRPTAVFTWRP